jgi:F0F1-type ATP synthase assembly protein I
MSISDPSKKKPSMVPVQRMAMMGGQIAGITLLIVFGGVFGGMWLDQLLGTKPIITIILVLGSAPLSLFLTYFAAMKALKDMNTQPPEDNSPSKGQVKPIHETSEEGGEDR